MLPLGVLLICTSALAAGDEKPAAKTDADAVRKLVEQLASADFSTRETATQELSKLEEVPEALRDATKSKDAEVRRRAQKAIEVITTRAEDRALKELVRWTVINDFKSNGPHDPLVVRDKVIVGTDKGQLRAYQCKDGALLWVHEQGARIFHRACSDGRRVYFGSAKGLTAVRVEDGAEVWKFGLAFCDGPALVLAKRGMVFVGGNDGSLYALEGETGKQVWVSDFIADAPPDPPNFPGERARLTNTKSRPSALATDGDTLFLSVFDQCRIVAVNATDGKRLWSFQTGGWIFGSAVSTERNVFFGSQDKAFYCLDKRTGKKVWAHPTKGRIESGGAVDGKFVYFGSCDGGVYCLNQSDGKAQWRFATDSGDRRGGAIYSVPLLQQGRVYFAAGEGQAYAVDQHTGQLKWKVRPSKGSELYCSPATDGALFFVVTRASSKDIGEPSLVAIGLK
jgi:outer membrane protein assembly factor BamB